MTKEKYRGFICLKRNFEPLTETSGASGTFLLSALSLKEQKLQVSYLSRSQDCKGKRLPFVSNAIATPPSSRVQIQNKMLDVPRFYIRLARPFLSQSHVASLKSQPTPPSFPLTFSRYFVKQRFRADVVEADARDAMASPSPSPSGVTLFSVSYHFL